MCQSFWLRFVWRANRIRPEERAASPLSDALARVEIAGRCSSCKPFSLGRRFNELLEEIPGSLRTSCRRLKRLERDAILISRPYIERPPRAAYELTAEGMELRGRFALALGVPARSPAEAPGTRRAVRLSRSLVLPDV